MTAVATYLQPIHQWDFMSSLNHFFQPLESPLDAPTELLLEKWMDPDDVNGGQRTENALVTFPLRLASRYSS
jgi:hypothetical protein